MRIFLVGVSCVGKTTVGAELAKLIDSHFFDLDDEIEKYFAMPIESLQEKFVTMESFLHEASQALLHLLSCKESQQAVIALTPSGLMNDYWNIVKQSEGVIIELTDNAENILKKIDFYDENSNLISKKLSAEDESYYLTDIRKDIFYYYQSYKRANISVSIPGLKPKQAAIKVRDHVQCYLGQQ